MRGGVFESGYRIDVADLKDSVRAFNRVVWARHRELLDGLGDEIHLSDLVGAVESVGDPDLLRRVVEYLPWRGVYFLDMPMTMLPD